MISVDIHRHPQTSMDILGYRRISMDIHGYSWISIWQCPIYLGFTCGGHTKIKEAGPKSDENWIAKRVILQDRRKCDNIWKGFHLMGRVDKNWAGRVSRAEPSRAGPPGGDRGWLIARSRKIGFATKKRSVSPTPNAYFSGIQFLSRGQCIGRSILPRNSTLQRTSRLRRTDIFNKLHSPTSVSSTPNTHFENKVSSRLHQMPAF